MKGCLRHSRSPNKRSTFVCTAGLLKSMLMRYHINVMRASVLWRERITFRSEGLSAPLPIAKQAVNVCLHGRIAQVHVDAIPHQRDESLRSLAGKNIVDHGHRQRMTVRVDHEEGGCQRWNLRKEVGYKGFAVFGYWIDAQILRVGFQRF